MDDGIEVTESGTMRRSARSVMSSAAFQAAVQSTERLRNLQVKNYQMRAVGKGFLIEMQVRVGGDWQRFYP